MYRVRTHKISRRSYKLEILLPEDEKRKVAPLREWSDGQAIRKFFYELRWLPAGAEIWLFVRERGGWRELKHAIKSSALQIS